VDEAKPAVGARHLGDEGVGVRVLVRLADGNEPEAEDEQAQRRAPAPQGVAYGLQGCSQCEQAAKVEVLTEVGVGDGGEEPAEEVRCEAV